MITKFIPLSATCLCLLAGCGGGSGNSSGNDIDTGSDDNSSSNADVGPEILFDSDKTEVLTGIFVDSAVEGVSYSTATQSGTTNSAGEFSYLDGEQVVFSIGATSLPAVTAAPQISPIEIASSSSNPDDTTSNVARLLQSLDIDGIPENGISISVEAAAGSAPIDFDVTTTEFENSTEVVNLVANSGSVTTALISEEAAIQHLEESLGIDLNFSELDQDQSSNEGLTSVSLPFISGGLVRLFLSEESQPESSVPLAPNFLALGANLRIDVINETGTFRVSEGTIVVDSNICFSVLPDLSNAQYQGFGDFTSEVVNDVDLDLPDFSEGNFRALSFADRDSSLPPFEFNDANSTQTMLSEVDVVVNGSGFRPQGNEGRIEGNSVCINPMGVERSININALFVGHPNGDMLLFFPYTPD